MGLDYFRYYSAWNDHANRRRWAAPADPWRKVRVDPTAVERFDVVSLKWGLGRVRGGDWDRPENCRRVDDTAFHEACHQRFEEGLPWAETAYADWAEERLEEQDAIKCYTSVDEFLAGYGAELDDLYESIRDEGYRPNDGVVYDGPEDAEYVHDLEPIVLVGRDGEVIWTEGFHRLIISRLLDVDAVPVYVLRRHEAWQRARDAVAGDGAVPGDLDAGGDHPDLRDVVS